MDHNNHLPAKRKALDVLTSVKLSVSQSPTQKVSAQALLDSPTLSLIAGAWEEIEVVWEPPVGEISPVEEDNILWQKMWAHCQWNPNQLAIASGMTVSETHIAVSRLKDLKLIFPDGTVSRSAGWALAMRAAGSAAKFTASLPRSKSKELPEPKKAEGSDTKNLN